MLIVSIVHLAFLIWFVSTWLTVGDNEDCLYVTRQLNTERAKLMQLSPETISKQKLTRIVWGPFNNSLLYVMDENTTLLYKHDDVLRRRCFVNVFHRDDITALLKIDANKERIVYIIEAADCVSYIWFFQVRSAVAALLCYVAFICVNTQRRAFGPWSNSDEKISSQTYYLNYWTSLLAKIRFGVYYVKLSRFLRETDYHRERKSRDFSIDPLGFYLTHPLALLLGLVEAILYISSLVSSATVLRVCFDACSQTIPMHVRVFAWVFVIVLALLEIACTAEEHNVRTGELKKPLTFPGTGIFTSCCANIISYLIVRVIYAIIVILIVIAALRYEHKLQETILG